VVQVRDGRKTGGRKGGPKAKVLCAETERRHARRAAALPQVIKSGVGLVRIGELADMLGVTRQTILEWETKKLLPGATRIGNITGWPGAVVRDLLAGKHGPEAA
jgi:predicted DNA-binding transcriptional regulator AlpA